MPDNWSCSYYTLYNPNSSGASFSSNVINSTIWANLLESHGAVFQPAAGYRSGSSVDDVGGYGSYWSASCSGSYGAYSVGFSDSYFSTVDSYYRYFGRSVRLVAPAEN